MSKERLTRALLDLHALMSRLRGTGGCPWDAQQTDTTIKMYLLEEAYEVLDAIERRLPADVCDELGDLLFQIIFLARLAEERGEFDFAQVMERITEKMKNRHPHVFGTAKVRGPEEVADNWEKIKIAERKDREESSRPFWGIPGDLPALLKAHRLSERASKRGLDRFDPEEAWERVEEKFDTLRKTVPEGRKEQVGEAVGALLFSLVSLARQQGLNAEHIMRKANQEFLERFEKMKGG